MSTTTGSCKTPTWVLGITPWSSARAVCFCNCGDLSPALPPSLVGLCLLSPVLSGERDALCQPGNPPGELEPLLAHHPDPHKALPAGGTRTKPRVSSVGGSSTAPSQDISKGSSLASLEMAWTYWELRVWSVALECRVAQVRSPCAAGRHRHPGPGRGGAGPQAHFLAAVPGAALSTHLPLLHDSGTSLEPGHSRGPPAPPPALPQVGAAQEEEVRD